MIVCQDEKCFSMFLYDLNASFMDWQERWTSTWCWTCPDFVKHGSRQKNKSCELLRWRRHCNSITQAWTQSCDLYYSWNSPVVSFHWLSLVSTDTWCTEWFKVRERARERGGENLCVAKACQTCMSTPGSWYWKVGSCQGGFLAHGNWVTNKQTDEQMKMDEWGLKDEDGWMHERENKQTIPVSLALTTRCCVLWQVLRDGAGTWGYMRNVSQK